MKALKATRRPKARNTGDAKVMHFCEADRDLPIAGTPAPKPCPFCGQTEVSLVFKRPKDNAGDSYTTAHVQCDVCGAEAGYVSDNEEGIDSGYDLALAAACLWNERKGGVK